MNKVNLWVCTASLLLILTVAFTFFFLGEKNAALNITSESQATLPFSLTGGGLILGIIRWFCSKLLLIVTTIFKLIIGFILLLAAGMTIAAF